MEIKRLNSRIFIPVIIERTFDIYCQNSNAFIIPAEFQTHAVGILAVALWQKEETIGKYIYNADQCEMIKYIRICH